MKHSQRAAAIIINGNEILLMERRNSKEHFFVFPGGHVEDGETIEGAIVREAMEETSVTVKITKKLYTHFYNSSNKWESTQFFYLCSYLSGEPQLGDANEKEDMKKGINFYKPQWFPISKINTLLLYPLEIRDWLLYDIKDNFVNTPREAHLKVEELRESL